MPKLYGSQYSTTALPADDLSAKKTHLGVELGAQTTANDSGNIR